MASKGFVLNRVGSVNDTDGRAHFMQGYDGMRTACGRKAVSAWSTTKDGGLRQVDCGSCWSVQRASLPRV